ncbi:MAG: sulfite reductase, partial [Verrucomicrobia bacterium]|nr:sulfite reductase [Verrucomicrobiota bacterium]
MIASNVQTELTRNELLKSSHPTLAGTIVPTLANPDVDHFSQEDYEFLKFHGVYQQDDRDKRKVAKQYIFMVRTKFPGGAIGPDQYLT